jgi:hypothetical protein
MTTKSPFEERGGVRCLTALAAPFMMGDEGIIKLACLVLSRFVVTSFREKRICGYSSHDDKLASVKRTQ